MRLSLQMRGGRVVVASLVVAACTLTSTVAFNAALPAGAAGAATTCRNVAVPIEVGGQSGNIAGTLCAPPGATTVQLLVPGWTYNRSYWSLPYQPGTYSYVNRANAAGYATLAIDRLGSGQSLHPLSLFDTMQADVATVHRVVTALRSGALGVPYAKVIEVGHSLGSIVAADEAGLFHDVDAIITTGFTHSLNYTNAYIEIAGHDELAAGDPKFASLGLDPLYLSSEPGTRALFNYAPNTDPAVIALDNTVLGDTDNLVEGGTIAAYPADNVDRTLNIPVFDVVGDHDPIFCGLNTASCTSSSALVTFERSFYAPGAPVVASLIPNTGHDINLEMSAPLAYGQMIGFSNLFVGTGGGQPGSSPGVQPAVTTPPAGTPPLDATLANELLIGAVEPLANAYMASIPPIPGLGTQSDPNPFAAIALAGVGDLVNELLGSLPVQLLADS
jgi:pimeloyl-ACP methyl ester carboxylesterase